MVSDKHQEYIEKLHQNGIPITDEHENIVSIFKILGNTTRLRIIIILEQDALSVNEISEALQMSQSSISHQLSLLKKENLVVSVRKGKSIHYQLADQHIIHIIEEAKNHIEQKAK